MKFNKWTLGLAAVGVVSLASAARADEKMNSLQTALSNTTISGSVSASFNWAITPGGSGNAYSPAGYIPFQGQGYGEYGYYNNPTKQDGFNLDVVRLTIAKPEDESPWASGYQVDLMFGPDAVGYNPSANAKNYYGYEYGNGEDFAIKQAYVTLRTPVGNGIDWKIGVFDTIIGYEVTDAGSDPNYTRSWGYAIEPTEHTGVLASYTINPEWSVSAGVANTLGAGINARDNASNVAYGADNYWHKTLLGSVTFTAPSSWGWAAGSSGYFGIVYGFAPTSGEYANYYGNYYYGGGNQFNLYAGATVNTPWKQLTTGIAFDYAHNYGGGYYDEWENVGVLGLYATYKATDKLSFNARGEYVNSTYYEGATYGSTASAIELTTTVEYDLWANVMTRLELRWDQDIDAKYFILNDDLDHKGSVGLYANVIYKF